MQTQNVKGRELSASLAFSSFLYFWNLIRLNQEVRVSNLPKLSTEVPSQCSAPGLFREANTSLTWGTRPECAADVTEPQCSVYGEPLKPSWKRYPRRDMMVV